MSEEKSTYNANTLLLPKAQLIPRPIKDREGTDLKHRIEFPEAQLTETGSPFTRDTILRLIATLKVR